MPTFTPDEITQTAVDRIFKPHRREELEARWQQMRTDPETAAEARDVEAYLRYLEENCECPIARFERIFGYPLPDLAADRAGDGAP